MCARLDVRLGIRLMVAAVLAMVLARLLNLSAYTWAGISALLVTTGHRGGSLRASLMRLGGTLVGLAVGSLMVLLVHPPLLSAALAILVAILACQALKLGTALRLGALSTLFPWMAVTVGHSTSQLWPTVLSRSENVLIGCVMALLVDVLLWPEPSSRLLGHRIRKDVSMLGDMARAILEAYVDGKSWEGQQVLQALQADRLVYSQYLSDLRSEPEDPEWPREDLVRQSEAAHRMVDHCAALADIHRAGLASAGGSTDTVQRLLDLSLMNLAQRMAEVSHAFGEHVGGQDVRLRQSQNALMEAGCRLEEAYETIRGDRGTQGYPSPEVFRLLGVLYHVGALVRGFSGL